MTARRPASRPAGFAPGRYPRRGRSLRSERLRARPVAVPRTTGGRENPVPGGSRGRTGRAGAAIAMRRIRRLTWRPANRMRHRPRPRRARARQPEGRPACPRASRRRCRCALAAWIRSEMGRRLRFHRVGCASGDRRDAWFSRAARWFRSRRGIPTRCPQTASLITSFPTK